MDFPRWRWMAATLLAACACGTPASAPAPRAAGAQDREPDAAPGPPDGAAPLRVVAQDPTTLIRATTAELAGPLADGIGAGQGFVVEPLGGAADGTLLGQVLADELCATLRGAGLSPVAAGADLDALLEHLGRQLGDAWAEGTTPAAGQRAGYRWVVRGEVLDAAGAFRVQARALDIESGRRIDVTAPLAASAVAALLAPAASAGRYDVTLGWTVDDPRGRPVDAGDFWSLSVSDGMELRLRLEADRRLHAAVFSRGSSGRGLLLLPHGGDERGLVEPGRPLDLPDAGLPPFAFEGAPGVESFWIVLAPTDLARHPELVGLLAAPRLPLRDGRLDISPDAFVPPAEAAALAGVLDGLLADGRQRRGAAEFLTRVEAGQGPEPAGFRDLGNARVEPPRHGVGAGRSSLERRAVLSGTGLTVVRFDVRHQP